MSEVCQRISFSIIHITRTSFNWCSLLRKTWTQKWNYLSLYPHLQLLARCVNRQPKFRFFRLVIFYGGFLDCNSLTFNRNWLCSVHLVITFRTRKFNTRSLFVFFDNFHVFFVVVDLRMSILFSSIFTQHQHIPSTSSSIRHAYDTTRLTTTKN